MLMFEFLCFVGVCAPGFGGNGSVCEKCPFGIYKTQGGNHDCTSCLEGTFVETIGEICVKCGVYFITRNEREREKYTGHHLNLKLDCGGFTLKTVFKLLA